VNDIIPKSQRYPNVNIKEIIKEYLEENDYDGLCLSATNCWCFLSDFMSCSQPEMTCEAGNKIPSTYEDTQTYRILPTKHNPWEGPDAEQEPEEFPDLKELLDFLEGATTQLPLAKD
jgi:hypothetical protein